MQATDMRQPALGTDAARHASSAITHTRVIGYTSGCAPDGVRSREVRQQADTIARECSRLAFELLEVVHERERAGERSSVRPGLSYALKRVSTGEVRGLVVAELSRIARSGRELAAIVEYLGRSGGRLVAVANNLDTQSESGRLAANVLVEVTQWERLRLSERTRSGLQAARQVGRTIGRPAVADDPLLRERIVQMRAQGMTLQAIADKLNEEGVPTVRGGARWRHSSVQAAAGYRRRQRSLEAIVFD